MEEMEALKDLIDLLKQELLLLQEKQEDDYQLLNERLDEISIKLSE